jgi:tetratricopeptide (TPR) repeat protein
MVGRTLGPYEILEQIGAGGMGVVYKALDNQLGRHVAIKVVSDSSLPDPQAQTRLMREARTASALNHPNICTVFTAGAEGNLTYIAMELIHGQPLTSIVANTGLPADAVIQYGVQIASALAHAHAQGVIHRDLKGANIMVDSSGQLKILDFGLAHRESIDAVCPTTLTQTGAVVGTVPYMAPEILQGRPADVRTDLWTFGVILHHALTGSLPFNGSTNFEIASSIQRDSPPPLPAGTPPPLVAVVRKLLAKDPAARYQTAAEVEAALETLQTPRAQESRFPPRVWLYFAAALPLLLLLLWLGSRPFTRTPAAPARLSDGAKPSPVREANEYYERALLFAGVGPRHDPPQVRHMLDRALQLDPRFAAARAQSSFARMVVVLQGDSVDPALLYQAEEDARAALRDDPNCGIAHSALAGIHYLRGRKDLLPSEVEAALKGNAEDATAHTWLTLYHWSNGDYAKAMRKSDEILSRWPLFWPGRLNRAEMVREQGDFQGARMTLEPTLEQDPHSRTALVTLARIYIDLHDLPKARQAMDQILPRDRGNFRVRINSALLLACEGKTDAALREFDKDVQAYAGNAFRGPLHAVEIYAVLNRPAQAFEWLDRAVRMGDDREDWLRRNPLLASIRPDPRFQQVLSSIAYRRAQSGHSSRNPTQ